MKFLSYLIITLLAVACSTRKKYETTAQAPVKDKSGMALQVNWVKDKKVKYDVEVVMTNESEKARIVMLPDIHCFKGDTRGILKHTFFNTGERTIDFQPGENKSFKMVCNHSAPVEGAFRLLVTEIYDNPEMDGATKGKIVGKNLEWTFSQ
ncbi:MAG: hypothetical protein H7A36_08085 [Chlamydiales bacterium]|nr:hypothetical protein [Chlamydiales bacterium]